MDRLYTDIYFRQSAMKQNMENKKNNNDLKLWLWVLFCIIVIFATIPVARDIQQFISGTTGREFFSHLVIASVCIATGILLYIFVFRLKVREAQRYFWIILCAFLYLYFTVRYTKHPEEAIHFLEYGLLSYFLFKALNNKIKDPTVYITALMFVIFIGTMDEFIQWIIPKRFWDWRDVGFNALAGGIFFLAVWKGIKPKTTGLPVKKTSIRLLVITITVNALFLSLCISNTPKMVNRYTSAFESLSWLKNEESMIEFGYRHRDSEIGAFYSRLTLKELRDTDLASGKDFGNTLLKTGTHDNTSKDLKKPYSPHTNMFLHEFTVHLKKRDINYDRFIQTNRQNERIIYSNAALMENTLIEKYFRNTLNHSGLGWSDEKKEALRAAASSWKGTYISRGGLNTITVFKQKDALLVIFILLIIVWISGAIWKARLNSRSYLRDQIYRK